MDDRPRCVDCDGPECLACDGTGLDLSAPDSMLDSPDDVAEDRRWRCALYGCSWWAWPLWEAMGWRTVTVRRPRRIAAKAAPGPVRPLTRGLSFIDPAEAPQLTLWGGP